MAEGQPQPAVTTADDFRLCENCGRSQTRTRINGAPLCTACARTRHGIAT